MKLEELLAGIAAEFSPVALASEDARAGRWWWEREQAREFVQ